MNQGLIDRLGVEVSNKCKWDGDDICAVFMEALTDANFHSLRTKLEAVIKQDVEESNAAFLESSKQNNN